MQRQELSGKLLRGVNSVSCCEWNICSTSKNKYHIPSVTEGFPIEIMFLKAFRK